MLFQDRLLDLFSDTRPRAAAVVLSSAALLAGCTTQKTLTVRTDPPGAHVKVAMVQQERYRGNPRSPLHVPGEVLEAVDGPSPFTYQFSGESAGAKYLAFPIVAGKLLFRFTGIPLLFPSTNPTIGADSQQIIVDVEHPGYVTRQYAFSPKNADTKTVLDLRLDPAGFAYTICSEPQPAAVYALVQGKWEFLGETDADGLQLPQFVPAGGALPVTVAKEGYLPAQGALSADGPYQLSFRLAPRDRAEKPLGTLRFEGAGAVYIDGARTATRADGSIALAPGDYLFELRSPDGARLYAQPVTVREKQETLVGPRK